MPDEPVRIVQPEELTDSEFTSIERVIGEGGEVATGHLPERLRSSHLIALKTCDGQLACVAAVKAARPEYIRSISAKSGYHLGNENCQGEFGYLVTKQEFRRRGLGVELSTALLKQFGGKLFATTRDDNPGVHRIIRENGFEPVGRGWRSVEHPDSMIILWLKK